MEHSPLQAAMLEQHLFPNPLTPPLSGDEFVARLAALPIAFQPGDGWLYDTGTDVLGVLLTRATGKPLSDLIAERVTGPLGMASTSFWTDGTGTTAHADPVRGTVCVLLTQRAMTSPLDGFGDFWAAVADAA